MNSKFFVPFETAKVLKEKGYPQEVYADGKVYTVPHGGFYPALDIYLARVLLNGNYIAAPTYHEVVDWLEGKGIYINSYAPTLKTEIGRYSTGLYDSNSEYWTSCSSVYSSREEALNAAILKALEIL